MPDSPVPISSLTLAPALADEDLLVVETAAGVRKIKGARFLRSASVSAIAMLPSGASAAQIAAKVNEILAAMQGSVAPTPTPSPTLAALTLSSSTFVIGASASGTINGATTGSTITASGLPSGLTINGALRTWAWSGSGSASTGNLTLTEALAGATNTPRASSIGYTVSATAPTLAALTFSTDFTVGVAVSGTITGATAGSTISTNIPGITVNSAARTYAGTPTTAGSYGFTETLAGATGSPRTTSVTVAAAPTAVTGDPLAITVLGAALIDVDAGSGYGVDPNGWVAKVTLKGLATGGTCDATKLTLTVSDPGYDTSGNPTTVTRVIPGHSVLRRMVPNSAQKMIAANGADLDVYVAIGDYIFAATTIVSATIAAGFYTGSNASKPALLAKTNASARPYWKPHLVWADMPDRRATGSSYGVEAYAAHRYARNGQMVPFIRFTASDGTHSTTATSNAPALSSVIAGTQRPEVYKGAIPLAGLDNGARITVNAQVYPWIGDASAVLDLSLDRTAPLTGRQQQALTFLCDRTGGYGGAIAYVDAGATWTAISSAEFNGTYPRTAAFDDIDGTTFHSTAIADPWLGMQFPVAISLRRISVLPSASFISAGPASLALEYSSDGTSWTQWGSTQSFSGWAAGVRQTADYGVGAPAAAYWRVRRPGGTTAIAIADLALMPDGATASVVYGRISATGSEARALPCRSIGEALERVRRFNAANRGHDDHSGSTIYLMDRAGAAQSHVITAAITTPAGLCWTEIRPDPLATGAVTVTTSAPNQVPDMLKWHVVPVLPSNPQWPVFYDTIGRAVAFEGISCDTTGVGTNGIINGYPRRYFLNCDDSGTATLNFFGLAGMAGIENSLIAGCTSAGALAGKCVLGCTTTGAYGITVGGTGASNDAVDGLVYANNRMLKVTNGTVYSFAFATRGGYFIQNLVEGAGAVVVVFNINADASSGNVAELLDWHNSTFGERGSRNYSETSATIGQTRIMSTRFAIFQNWNNKTDTLGGVVGATSSWAYAYDVGNAGNVSIDGSVGGMAPSNDGGPVTYLGHYKEPGTNYAADPTTHCAAAFVNPQAGAHGVAVYGTGAGGGDYRLTNHAAAAVFKSRVPAGLSVLKYDLDGVLRKTNGTGACGPYEATT